jgi:hypothetical protein
MPRRKLIFLIEISESYNFLGVMQHSIGLIIGLLNITSKETSAFLMSSISLIIASFFGAGITASVEIISIILGVLLTLFVPATIVVAVKNVFKLAKG